MENQRGDGALPEVFEVIHEEMVVRKGTYELTQSCFAGYALMVALCMALKFD